MVHELYYKMGCENDLMELENEPCAEGKAQHTKFPREENTRDQKLDRVHTMDTLQRRTNPRNEIF